MDDTDVLIGLKNLYDEIRGNLYPTDWRRVAVMKAIAEIERLRASHGPVCQHSWHNLADRIVTGCGNETDRIGAFCQFCGGKVEAV